MSAFETRFVAANRALVAIVLALVFVIVFVNVVGRYAFSTSLPWAEEVARHLMIFGAFAGAGLALREGRLVAIDALLERLPGTRPAQVVRWGGVALMAVFMVVVAWYGARFVAFGWSKETMATQIPRGIPYLAIPLGASLFLVHLALFARRFVAGAFEASGEEEMG